jgi:dephospho-CoA kinase
MDVVVFCGKMGAGKSTAAQHLSTSFGLPTLSFTKAVFNPILQVLRVEPSRASYQEIGKVLASWPGERQLLTALLAESEGNSTVVLDDVRYKMTGQTVRSLAERSIFIYVEASFEERYSRLKRRDGVTSMTDQRLVESAPTESQIDELREFADVVVINEHAADDFLQRIEHIARAFVRQ